MSYLKKAFELSRVFLFKWTVNWRFVGEETFLSKPFSQLLLVAHAGLLAAFAASRWLDPSGLTVPQAFAELFTSNEQTQPKPDATAFEQPNPSSAATRQTSASRSKTELERSRQITPTFVMTAVLQSMLIGCLCARSLHYQFYAYIAWSTPFLMWRSGLGPVPTVLVWAAQEWAWNVFPSTDASSMTVVICLAVTIAGSWYGTRGRTRNLGIDKDGSDKKTA